MQIQKEAAAKQYANMRYDQPYQAALFEMKVLLEAQRWHTDEYEAVIGGLEPDDLKVRVSTQLAHLPTLAALACAICVGQVPCAGSHTAACVAVLALYKR